MISQETKDIIEKESIEFVRELFIDYGDLNAQAEIEIQNAWQVGATKYAEKLEEKDKIIESKDQDIADLKDKVIEHNANAASVGAADAEENWAKEKDDLLRDKAYWQLEAQAKYHEITNCKKSHELLESSLSTLNEELIFKRGELAQLKEIAERMAKTLKGLGGIEAWINDRQVKEHFQETVYPALTAYAEWCKQNLK